MKLTEKDIAALERQSDAVLREWLDDLNVWRWPIGLPDPELPKYSKANRRGLAVDWIKRRLGFSSSDSWVEVMIDTAEAVDIDEFFDEIRWRNDPMHLLKFMPQWALNLFWNTEQFADNVTDYGLRGAWIISKKGYRYKD